MKTPVNYTNENPRYNIHVKGIFLRKILQSLKIWYVPSMSYKGII